MGRGGGGREGDQVTGLLVELPLRLSLTGGEDSFHLIIVPDCPGQVSARDSEKLHMAPERAPKK